MLFQEKTFSKEKIRGPYFQGFKEYIKTHGFLTLFGQNVRYAAAARKTVRREAPGSKTTTLSRIRDVTFKNLWVFVAFQITCLNVFTISLTFFVKNLKFSNVSTISFTFLLN